MKKPSTVRKRKQYLGKVVVPLYSRIRTNRFIKNRTSPLYYIDRVRVDHALVALGNKAYTHIGSLEAEAYVTKEPLPFERRFEGKKVAVKEGSVWAEEVFDCAWMHVTGVIPEGYKAEEVVFLIDTGGEGLIYDKEGNIKQGITCHASNFSYNLGLPYKEVVFTDGLTDGKNIEFYIDCGANDLFGNMKNRSAVQRLWIAVMNTNIRGLMYDIEALLGVTDHNKKSEYTRELYSAIRKAIRNIGNITEEKSIEIRKSLKKFLDAKNEGEVFEYSAIGHAHLDLAWLWPIRESYRKGARTLSNQFLNIERYKDYKFGASQAQLYVWMKEYYPELYKKIFRYKEEGRWEVQGATWVEMDSNLIGGESLVRQFYYGKKFFKEEFGEDIKVLWVPDSFGYSACIPQVMKLAGVPYFLTQKLSWNTVNKFPYHTFYWESLDGSRVLAHMLPENTYNSPMRGDFLKYGEKNYSERSISPISMLLFGIGDGGGGPGFEHIERLERLRDLKGLPKVKPETGIDFFGKLDDKNIPYPSHRGELYLERHQGTYTTRVKNKYYNRKCEFLLRNYELLLPFAGGEAPVSREELENIWKEVLLYQFHDILPGSSINRVYDESVARYEIIADKLTNGIKKILSRMSGRAAVNLNSFGAERLVEYGGGWYKLPMKPFSVTGITEERRVTKFSASAGENRIENDKVKVTFKDGLITSLYNKATGREYAGGGKTLNLFTIYEDRGDCWDIRPVKYQKKKKHAVCAGFTTGVNGAEAYADVQYKVGKTLIRQRISILDGSPLVSFKTEIDYHADSSMLRVAFPVDVKTEVCKFNVQFGHVERRTTENNSVEKAQYEVSGQKFIDMSDNNGGISLITDCKYGYRVKNGVMDIDLVRSPKGGPGKKVDQGISNVIYALYPHEGSLGADTYREAYFINNPPIIMGGETAAPDADFYATDNESIVLEALQEVEGGFIARFYNSTEAPQSASVSIKGYKAKEVTDIMVNKIGEVSEKLTLRPFELINIRYERQA